MKFRLLTLLLLCCGAAATAQNPYIVPEGATESASGISVNLPRSVIAVDLTVERTAVLCGPYARYAQKYLGVRAPLTDKTTWSIADARIALAGDAVYEAPAPAPAPAPAAAPAPAGAGEQISAPMPGTILDVKVTAGQAVKSGDVLMILEAMKMENEIMAPHDGTITSVAVAKGSSVESGALLCTIA